MLKSSSCSLLYFFIYFLFGLELNLIKLLLLIISISTIIFILFVNPKIKNRVIDQAILNTQGGKYIFSRVHESHFRTTLNMFVDKPLFGHGPK